MFMLPTHMHTSLRIPQPILAQDLFIPFGGVDRRQCTFASLLAQTGIVAPALLWHCFCIESIFSVGPSAVAGSTGYLCQELPCVLQDGLQLAAFHLPV